MKNNLKILGIILTLIASIFISIFAYLGFKVSLFVAEDEVVVEDPLDGNRGYTGYMDRVSYPFIIDRSGKRIIEILEYSASSTECLWKIDKGLMKVTKECKQQ